ncbi:MAG: SIMPL domain-containing protein [Thermacetogeniaceae bacterium]
MKEFAKKFSVMLLLTCVLALSVLLSGIAAVQPATASTEEEIPQIAVTGCGSVSVSPDQAKVSLGVLTIAPTAGEAQRENSSKANKIISALVAAGIPKDKIATQNYTIWPEYSYPKPEENKPPTITAYRVNNTILVTLDDITKVGQIIDTAVAAGANQVESIQFLRQDTGPAQREALQKACQEARSKAEAIAQSLGLQILGVQSVQESSSVALPPALSGGMKALESGATPTPIEPGEIKVSATVTVVFKVK